MATNFQNLQGFTRFWRLQSLLFSDLMVRGEKTSMNPRFLTAKYYKVFKAIFGNEENLDLTKRLLELILHKKVKDIKVRNSERTVGKDEGRAEGLAEGRKEERI